MGKEITLDSAALAELVNAKVEAALAQIISTHKAEPNDPTMRRLAEADRLNSETRRTWYRRCKSPLTNALFTAKLTESRGFPQGRIVDLGITEDGARDYSEAPEYTKHAGDGGLVPDNIAIKTAQGGFTREYMKWKCGNNSWVRDLREWVGKPWSEYLASQEKAA